MRDAAEGHSTWPEAPLPASPHEFLTTAGYDENVRTIEDLDRPSVSTESEGERPGRIRRPRPALPRGAIHRLLRTTGVRGRASLAPIPAMGAFPRLPPDPAPLARQAAPLLPPSIYLQSASSTPATAATRWSSPRPDRPVRAAGRWRRSAAPSRCCRPIHASSSLNRGFRSRGRTPSVGTRSLEGCRRNPGDGRGSRFMRARTSPLQRCLPCMRRRMSAT